MLKNIMGKIIIFVFFVSIFNLKAQKIDDSKATILYEDCLNKITINNPNNKNYDLDVLFPETKVEKVDYKTFNVVIPQNTSNKKIKMDAKAKEKVVKKISYEYLVKKFPLIETAMYNPDSNSPEFDLKNPINISDDTKLAIKAYISPEIAKLIPKDSQCKIKTFTIRQFRDLRCILNQEIEGDMYDIGKNITDRRAGDGIQIEITSVSRVNHAGEERIFVDGKKEIAAQYHSFYIK